MPIREDWLKEFEECGVEGMRKRITASIFNHEKLKQAQVWIDEKEHGEERAFRRESSDTARSAKNAAWVAATAAIIAAIFAGIAIFK